MENFINPFPQILSMINIETVSNQLKGDLPFLGLFLILLLLELFAASPENSTIHKILKPSVSVLWDIMGAILTISGIRTILANVFLLGVFAYISNLIANSQVSISLDAPFIVKVLLSFIISDFLTYWTHRIKHQNSWFWITHEFHHSATEITALTKYRVHPLNSILNMPFVVAPVSILFAGDLRVILYSKLLEELFGAFSHARFDTSLGWLGRNVFVTPRFHHLHHSITDVKNKNFGNGLVVWDKLFGTYLEPKFSIDSIAIGMENNHYMKKVSFYPFIKSAINFYLYPFRQVKKLGIKLD